MWNGRLLPLLAYYKPSSTNCRCSGAKVPLKFLQYLYWLGKKSIKLRMSTYQNFFLNLSLPPPSRVCSCFLILRTCYDLVVLFRFRRIFSPINVIAIFTVSPSFNHYFLYSILGAKKKYFSYISRWLLMLCFKYAPVVLYFPL